jgi:hypothetical protein
VRSKLSQQFLLAECRWVVTTPRTHSSRRALATSEQIVSRATPENRRPTLYQTAANLAENTQNAHRSQLPGEGGPVPDMLPAAQDAELQRHGCLLCDLQVNSCLRVAIASLSVEEASSVEVALCSMIASLFR